MKILSTIYGYLAAGLAVLLAIATAGLYGRHKGKQAAQQAEAARDAKAAAQAAQQVTRAHEVRNDVEAENAKLPDAPAQQVGAADPATAAGELRDAGWTRD